MNESENDVIYTPVYRGDRYLHHECSGCGYHVKIQEDVFVPLYFGERFKYCPNCASEVARFANLPKFVEEFNYAILEKLDRMSEEFRDKVDYYCRVTLTQKELEEIISKCEFAVQIDENGGRSASTAVCMVAKMNPKKWNHWEIKKLKERVETKGADVCKT